MMAIDMLQRAMCKAARHDVTIKNMDPFERGDIVRVQTTNFSGQPFTFVAIITGRSGRFGLGGMWHYEVMRLEPNARYRSFAAAERECTLIARPGGNDHDSK